MKKIVLVLCVLTFNIGLAQDYKFGKVSKEELSENQNDDAEPLHAVVLQKNLTISYDFTDDGFRQVREVYERIKIYDKEGYDWATKSQKLYDESSIKSEQILGLKGYTYNLVNGKVEKTKLKNENIFEEKTNDYWATTKFTMPNIKEGSIIEYEYRVESPFISIPDVKLQYEIPINKLHVNIKIPEYYIFQNTLNPRAIFRPNITQTTISRNETITNSQITSGKGWNGVQVGTNDKYSQWRFTENKIEVNEVNIPALKTEPYVDNLNNYRAKLIMDYNAFKGADGIEKHYSTTWEKVTKEIYNRDDFGSQLIKKNYFEEDLDALLSNISLPIKRVAAIYSFVKSKVKWNGYYGKTADNGVKKAYKEGEGNVGDINLMLTAMLKHAGLNASPVLISSRNNGIPLTPTLSGFNYVISAVELPEGIILLDATSEFATANILPTRAINWQGRIVRDAINSDWIDLKPKMISKEVTLFNIKINEDLSVTGKVRNQYTNHLAMAHRNKFNSLSADSHLMSLEKDKGDIKISNVETKGKNKLDKPILVSYDYTFENGIEEIGDKMYFSPLLFLTPKENPFKRNTRDYPIDFVHLISESFKVNIMLPDGYSVETLPENSKINFNGTEATFSYLAQVNGNILQLVINSNFNKLIILPKEYEQFKIFYQMMVEKKMEKIVLNKS